MRPVRIQEIRSARVGGRCEISARIAGLHSAPGEDTLWFRFPAAAEHWLAEAPEAFVAALLPTAMLRNQPLQCDIPVSPLFRDSCDQILDLYHAWDPRLRRIDLIVPTAMPAREQAAANGCFFTCGVDSFYTVLKNLARERGENRITHLVFIRGYADCPLENETLFENLSNRIAAAADALGLSFLAAETNLKEFLPPPGAAWDWQAGSQLASVGLCLGAGFRRLYVPAGDTYSTLSPWGSHPLVDPLWSTETLEFRHDGCEAFRSQKLERYVARSRAALKYLRVCGYESTGLRNCGACEKCLRTMIGLAALGVDVPPGLFAKPLDLRRVSRLDGRNRVIGYYLRDNLRLLSALGGNADLEEAVRQALQPSLLRRVLRAVETGGREFDRRCLGGRLRSWALAGAGRDPERQSDLRSSPAGWVLRQIWQRSRGGES